METICSLGKAEDQYAQVCMCLKFPINPQQKKYPFLPESMELYGRVRLLFYFWHWIFRTEFMIHLENNVQTESPVPRDLAFQSSHTLLLLFRGLSSETTALELVIWLNIRITFLFGSCELVFGQRRNTFCFLNQFQVWRQSI